MSYLNTILVVVFACLIFAGALCKIQGWSWPAGQIMLGIGMGGVVMTALMSARSSKS